MSAIEFPLGLTRVTNNLKFSRWAHVVGQRGAGSGGLPARRGFTTVFNKSNQKGAPKVTAKVVRSTPMIFQIQSLAQPGMERASVGSAPEPGRERFHPMGGTLMERRVAAI